MNCKNCGHIADGNYCSHCGQSTKIERFTLKNVISELSETLFQVNKGFFYTILVLFKSPGRNLHDYLNGKRIIYFKPIAFVLTLSTIYFLSSKFIGQNTWVDDFISGYAEGLVEKNDTQNNVPTFLYWLASNFAFTNLLFLPIFSLASYLAFLGNKENYTEHLIINAYIVGQSCIIYIIGGLIYKLTNIYYLEPLAIGMSVIYNLFVYWHFFSKGNRFINVLRTTLTYILYLSFSIVFFIVVMSIYKLSN